MKALWVTDRRAAGNERFQELLDTLAGTPGLTVQLRERGTRDREALEWAGRARIALGRTTPLYVNRRADIALAAGADGVHLPASGLPLPRVRRAAPRGLRVGVSTHSAAEAVHAIEGGADLVVLGPIFDTPSKRQYGAPLGPEALAALPPRAEHGSEVYAIGGIGADNVARLDPWLDRIDGVAAIRYFQEAKDPRGAAQALARRAAC